MTNQQYSDSKNVIVVAGTGNQAPYGIGEIMVTFKPTAAGLKKARKYAEKYHNQPSIYVPVTSNLEVVNA